MELQLLNYLRRSTDFLNQFQYSNHFNGQFILICMQISIQNYCKSFPQCRIIIVGYQLKIGNSLKIIWFYLPVQLKSKLIERAHKWHVVCSLDFVTLRHLNVIDRMTMKMICHDWKLKILRKIDRSIRNLEYNFRAMIYFVCNCALKAQQLF